MVHPIMQTHSWGIWLDLYPPYPRSDYSRLKANSGNGIDCAFCSIARSCRRSSPSSRTRSSLYEFRILCSSGTGTNNIDSSNKNPITYDADTDSVDEVYCPESEGYDDDHMDDDGSGIEIQVEKIAQNRRRIQARVSVKASLDTVWNILTDYERLSDFIPSLTVSQLLEKRDKFARLLQVSSSACSSVAKKTSTNLRFKDC